MFPILSYMKYIVRKSTYFMDIREEIDAFDLFNPPSDKDEISHKAGNATLEDSRVALNDVLIANLSLVFLRNNWLHKKLS